MAKRFKKYFKSFTLIELIIVIAIIAVLGTSAFLLLTQWMSKGRDASRIQDLVQIEKGLNIYYSQYSTFPLPSYNLMNIYGSGTDNLIGYQGGFGSGNISQINITGRLQDPVDKNYYTYVVNKDKNSYGIGGFVENEKSLSITSKLLAAQESRYFRQLGKGLPSITDENFLPLQELKTSTFTGLDIVNTEQSYILHFQENVSVKGTGTNMIAYLYSVAQTQKDIENIISMDKSLIGNWDMETTTVDGKLKDLTDNGNNGTLYGGVELGLDNGVNGKSTYFDGTDDYINLGNSSIFNTKLLTISLRVRFDRAGSDFPLNEYVLSKGASSFVPNLFYGSYSIHTSNGGVDKDYFSLSTDSGIGNETKSSKRFPELIVADPTLYNSNQYYDFTITYDGNTVSFYKNGTIINSQILGVELKDSNYDLLLGKNGHATIFRWFKGSLDDLKIYNRVLSPIEIKQNHQLK